VPIKSEIVFGSCISGKNLLLQSKHSKAGIFIAKLLREDYSSPTTSSVTTEKTSESVSIKNKTVFVSCISGKNFLLQSKHSKAGVFIAKLLREDYSSPTTSIATTEEPSEPVSIKSETVSVS